MGYYYKLVFTVLTRKSNVDNTKFEYRSGNKIYVKILTKNSERKTVFIIINNDNKKETRKNIKIKIFNIILSFNSTDE